MSNNNILTRIVNTRRDRIRREGHAQQADVPPVRTAPPPVPFPRGGLICEIKRRSPSRGSFIADGAGEPAWDAVKQADLYAELDVQTVSVLTEQDYFQGSLTDLMRIKNARPNLCVLRKDFLLEEQDVEMSYRAGADAVLLMASVLPPARLSALYKATCAKGMGALVEVHNEQEADDVMCHVSPSVVGINCRDLTTFVLDKLTPLKLAQRVRAPTSSVTHCVYESAVFHPSDVHFARDSGCSTVLVGEAAVLYPQRIPALRNAAMTGEPTDIHSEHTRFWNDILRLKSTCPIVKLCGLCRDDDVQFAVDSGADMVGFILAQSSRMVSADFVTSMREKNRIPDTMPAIGVVVGAPEEKHITLVRRGVLQALQVHNAPEHANIPVPWYRAVQLGAKSDIARAHQSGTPRVLVDGHSATLAGGTGIRVDDALIREVSAHMPLWLAGGLNCDNIAQVLDEHKPELVDVSSGVEESPGIKNHKKIRQFVRTVKKHG